jgi:hypothetical protein
LFSVRRMAAAFCGMEIIFTADRQLLPNSLY